MKRWQLQRDDDGGGAAWAIVAAQDSQRRWLPGDSHIHGQWSANYDEKMNQSLIGVDGCIRRRSMRIRLEHGLAWMGHRSRRSHHAS
jgi:hypothetical protein